MKIPMAARRTVAAVALSTSAIAGLGAVAVGSAATASARPVVTPQVQGFGICQLFSGVPVLQKVGICKKPAEPNPIPQAPTLPEIPAASASTER
jgi:hypothetical protein